MEVEEHTAVIRTARPEDVDAIARLLAGYARMGNVLPRPKSEILRNIGMFRVAESESVVTGCGALEVFTADLAEIRSLVVVEAAKGTGVGRRLVERLMEDARERGHRRLMALTYVPGFFHRLGFETVSRDTFPEKVWGICVTCYKFHRCDEIAVLRNL
ncbi:MAG: N-acetyltransferase [Arenicellales bacterium]